MSGGKKSVFWGIALLLLAAALLAQKLGYLKGIGFWPVLFTVILAAFLIKGIIRGSFGTILFSLAFLVIVNDELLHLEAITPWPVLGAALLGTIGLKLLFPGFGHQWMRYLFPGCSRQWQKCFRKGEYSGIITQENREGGYLTYDNVFGTIVKYVSGDVEDITMDNVFGSMSVYFMDARLPGGTLTITLDSVFGSVVLYIPSSWKAEASMGKIFSSVREKGKCDPDGVNKVYISGDVVFGELVIVYI